MYRRSDFPRRVSMAKGQLGADLHQASAGAAAPAAGELTDGQLLQRFITRNDEIAFAALVQRHGPMVLAVCRRVLQDWHHAEDAFQATFLTLARKAGAIGQPELLANWLYGVAYRTALKAKTRAARRWQSEREVASMPRAEPTRDETWRELQAVLDEEMAQIPEKYRAPLILCYLEGKTNEEAARLLHWPTGSMSRRISRGLELLRQRLHQRGLRCSPGLFPTMLARQAGPIQVPSALADATVEAAVAAAGGEVIATATLAAATAGGSSALLKALLLARLSRTAALLVGAAVLALATGVVSYGSWAGTAGMPRSCHAPASAPAPSPANDGSGGGPSAGTP
jgi:RNA polymerase sigma factor (sigma-70 family)